MPDDRATQRPLKSSADLGPAVDAGDPLIELLRGWRSERARTDGVPAYTLFSDRTLREIAMLHPRNLQELELAHGIGPARREKYGAGLLAVVLAGGAA